MKTLKSLFALILLAAILGGISSCNKVVDKKGICRISTATVSPAGSMYRFTYNFDGTVSRIDFAKTSAIFNYSGNLTTVFFLDSLGVITGKNIITRNADGLATQVRNEFDATGTFWRNTIYEYNGKEVARSILTSSDNGNTVISTYTWANQNMVASTTGVTTNTYEYYLDKPRQEGDYISLTQLIQGYEVFFTKNLLKSGSGFNFNYNFRSDGKISSLMYTVGNVISTIDYEYICEIE